MPFEFMAKASRTVKIEKEQISGIKLKSTVSLFLLYPLCCEIQYFVLNDDFGASKTMAPASSRNGYLPDWQIRVGDRSVAECCDGRGVLVTGVLHNVMMAVA